ncbi:MAG: protein FxsA [Actinomycetota bacterium]|nr:protein FxsA [Actinomycetota bacterium]
MEGVIAILAILFIVVPIVELAVIIQVGQAIGVLNTIAVLLLVSAVGAWLVKREGLAVWGRFQRQVQMGVVPSREMADGVLILVAGALLLSPGFVTDIFGILLLLPPVRAAIRSAAIYRAGRRVGKVVRVTRG